MRETPKPPRATIRSPTPIIKARLGAKLLLNEPALDKLQALRDRLGKPLIVTSAYRSPEHNRAVGGSKRSKHIEGAAFDISMANQDPEVFEGAARAVGFLGFRFYPRSGFIHVDLGPTRQRSERFPVRAIAFAEDASIRSPATVIEAVRAKRLDPCAGADDAAGAKKSDEKESVTPSRDASVREPQATKCRTVLLPA